MRILMLTPYLPYPPSSGGQVRSYNLLKYLSRRHEITLFSLIKDPSEQKYVSELEKFCKKVYVFSRSKTPWTVRNILMTGLGYYPFLVIRNLSSKERMAIKNELEQHPYDLIHAECFYVMPHIPPTEVPILLVEQTIEHLVYKHYVENLRNYFLRVILWIDLQKLKFWERYFWKKAQRVVAVSEADRFEMLRLEPNLKVDLVSNGVDLNFFKAKTSWNSYAPKLLFVSNFKWLQNVEAAEILVNDILPKVKKEINDVKLWIVGQHIPKKILEMANNDVIVDALNEQDVDSIRRVYNEASVFVSPMKGPGGTRLKNLAAMASKLPVVTTKIGAEGIGVRDGIEAIIRDDPESIAKGIIDLVRNPDKAKKIAGAARILAEKQFSWEIMGKKLDLVYSTVIKHKK